MSALTQSRQSELDRVLDQLPVSEQLGNELFGVVDALDNESALRRALSDPGAPAEAKAALVQRLLGGKVSETAVSLVSAASGLHWNSARALVDAIERQGVRAEFKQALASGRFDAVSDELFRFGRTVAGDDALRDALSSSHVPLQAREQVVDRLLTGRTEAATQTLAKRALKARTGNFAASLDNYSQIAAALRDRSVAKVTAARPLDEGQLARLRAALAKMVGHEVDVQLIVDPEVLGGLRVQVGDEVVDGTVAQRLEQARRQIA